MSESRSPEQVELDERRLISRAVRLQLEAQRQESQSRAAAQSVLRAEDAARYRAGLPA